MGENYSILINRLENFIRKYYRNEVLKGLFLLTFLFIISFLIVSVTEYFFRFSVMVRSVLFYVLIFAWLTVLINFIIVPLLKLLRGWRRMNRKEASFMISAHFTEIRDQLLNVLELAEMPQKRSVSAELVTASINHKISRISPFSFDMAIDRTKTRAFLIRLILSALVFASVFIFSPHVIKQGSERIINYSTVFVPESPFTFILENDTLNVEKGKDFDVLLRVDGAVLPNIIYLSYGDAKFAMEKYTHGKYRYTLHNVNNPLTFHFNADEYLSANYTLNIMPAPSVVSFIIEADVPEYTGEKDFTQQQNGDITVPAGTRLKWIFNTDQVDEMFLIFNDSIKEKPESGKNEFTHKKRVVSSLRYSLGLKNKYFTKPDIMGYYINVVPDLYPSIRTETIADSIKPGVYYFRGRVSDDYGFSRLNFTYTAGKDSVINVNVPISRGTSNQDFFFMYDFASVTAPGDGIEFFFEIWDNDGVSGPKSARSQKESFAIPTQQEVEDFMKNAGKAVEKKIEESSKLSKNIKDDLNKLKQEMLNREMTSFEKSQKLKSIMEQYKQLQETVNEVSKEYQKKNEYLNTFSEQESDIVEKQKQIEELLENIMDDEMKKMMEELNKLMEEFDKNKLNEITKKLDYNLDDLNRQLDRNLELLKKMEVEEKLNTLSDKLMDLAEKQEELSQETKNTKGVNPDLIEKQKEISEEFKKISDEYNKLLEKNQELSRPVKMPDMSEPSDKVNSEMQQSQEKMQEGSNSKASSNQKNAANQMKKMGEDMKKTQQQGSCNSQSEDMDNLRNIMDNLLKYSYAQESLMSSVKTVSQRDPKFLDKIREQKELNDNFRVIRDSLYELSKRTPMISSVINKEIREIGQNSDEIVGLLDERKVSQARTQQQQVMTSANNLALLLDEILDQMIKQSQQNSSSSQCQKPGNGQMSLQQMKSLQQSLKDQMQSMIEQMKGQRPKEGEGKGNSEKLGKMLAEQEKFRQMMNQMMQNGGLSPKAGQSLKEINQLLEEIEKDIIKRNVGQHTLLRQEQILTRLLEAENSEFQRERENKRESQSGQNKDYGNPEEIFKYKGLNSPLNESLDENKIKLVRFYNNKYKQYLNTLNE